MGTCCSNVPEQKDQITTDTKNPKSPNEEQEYN